jgi:hypothetical protein
LVDHLGTKLRSTKSQKIKTIIAGDFNLDFGKIGDDSYAHKAMLNNLGQWAASHGLSQHIKVPTRHRLVHAKEGDRNEIAILDHLYSQEDESPEVFQCGTSDHLAIKLDIGSKSHKVKTLKSISRDWRKYNDPIKFAKAINNHEITELMREASAIDDPGVLNEIITTIHSQLLNKLAPIRVFRTRNEHQIICLSVEALKKRRNRR